MNNKLILVYSEIINARVKYTFEFILKSICGFNYKLTSDKEAYVLYAGPAINYSTHPLKAKEICILPNGLLHQNTILYCTAIIKGTENDYQLIFESTSLKNHFDVVAAIFYLISRYEEYLPFIPDLHGRYKATDSVLYKANLLLTPIVDQWALKLKEDIINLYPEIPFETKAFQSIITIDVDQAYAFKYRGLKRNLISFIKNVFTANTQFLKSQLNVLVKQKADPFDTFEYLKTIQLKTKLSFLYFFNVGKYSAYDKNLPVTNKHFKELIQQVCSYTDIGLHPSYFSDAGLAVLEQEKQNLKTLSGKEIFKSRQHYLKNKLPDTYRNLVRSGIKEDYSLGYATHAGFRAGTCTPFLWFDLEKNEIATLKIFPITFMEGSLPHVCTEAEEIIEKITTAVKKVNGLYISIWHNHTVNDKFYWAGWKSVFEKSLNSLLRN